MNSIHSSNLVDFYRNCGDRPLCCHPACSSCQVVHMVGGSVSTLKPTASHFICPTNIINEGSVIPLAVVADVKYNRQLQASIIVDYLKL